MRARNGKGCSFALGVRLIFQKVEGAKVAKALAH